MQQVGDTIIYSEDPSGIRLMYLDKGLYEPKWKGNRKDKETPWYPAQMLREHNPNLCTPEEWRDMEEKLRHTPGSVTEICVYYKRNRCKHGISGKVPVGRSKECEAIHP